MYSDFFSMMKSIKKMIKIIILSSINGQMAILNGDDCICSYELYTFLLTNLEINAIT